MKSFRTIERRIFGEIMGTDILIRIASKDATKLEMEQSVERALQTMRSFSDRYSRFIIGNELWHFNESTGGPVSAELYELLRHANEHFQKTDGYFDPGILPALETEGYAGAYSGKITYQPASFGLLKFDPVTRSVRKPKRLKIDFGGFGKGYIVDRVMADLAREYPHVLVDAGGDIAVRGSDVGRGESHWVIGVENPVLPSQSDAYLLILTNQAVATSGKNRRVWKTTGVEKHHLIDPRTNQSSTSDLVAVTVIAPTCEAADVLAKTLFLMGSTAAQATALAKKIPAILFTHDTNIINSYAQPYVWTTP
ncbi:MAG: FAD:protein FMN transferase [Candidatus Moraniibacteriota bacterium]